MWTMSSQTMLARLDHLDRVMNFIAQCPASKRGRPMNPGAAISAEKKHAGSVCMKVSRARDGRGQRHIFYKIDSRAEKAAKKAAQAAHKVQPQAEHKAPAQAEHKEKPQAEQPTSSAQKIAVNVHLIPHVAAASKEGALTQVPRIEQPKFKSPIESTSETQKKWAKAFHHEVARKLSSFTSQVQSQNPEYAPYAQEAVGNLVKVTNPGAIFGLKSMQPVHMFWSLLSSDSAKRLAESVGVNLASDKHGDKFARIMRNKFKDDPAFQEAQAGGKAYPSLLTNHPPAVATVIPDVAPAATALPTTSPSPVAAKPQSRMARMKAKIATATGKAKQKAAEVKEKVDAWKKKHPVISAIAPSAAKIALGALGVGLSAQYPNVLKMNLLKLDHIDKVLKFYAQCPASKRGRPMGVGKAVQLENLKGG